MQTKTQPGETRNPSNAMKTMMRMSMAVFVVLASVLASNLFGLSGDDAPVSIPLTSVPTFSTEKIGRQGHFYVGGKWVGEPGKERMRRYVC